VVPHVLKEDGTSFFMVKQLKKSGLVGLLDPPGLEHHVPS